MYNTLYYNSNNNIYILMTELNYGLAEGLLRIGLIDKMPQVKLKHIYFEKGIKRKDNYVQRIKNLVKDKS